MAAPAPLTDVEPAIQQFSTDIGAVVPSIVQDVKDKDYAALATAVENLYGQVSPQVPAVVQESKAGYKTTEFYLVIVYEALTQSGAIHLPGTWGKAVAGISGLVAYVLSRGVAKSGVGNQVLSV